MKTKAIEHAESTKKNSAFMKNLKADARADSTAEDAKYAKATADEAAAKAKESRDNVEAIMKKHKAMIEDSDFDESVKAAGLDKAEKDEKKTPEAKEKEAAELEKKGDKAVSNAEKREGKEKD